MVSKFRKILLINPPAPVRRPYPPFGLLSLAAYLESKNTCLCDIIDFDCLGLDDLGDLKPIQAPSVERQVSWDEVESYISNADYDIFGLSLTFSLNFQSTQRVASLIRKHHPDSVIVVGGNHTSSMPKQTLEQIPEIDYAICGEGEKTLTMLINALKGGTDISNIPALVHRDSSGQPTDFNGIPQLLEMSELPFEAIDKIPIRTYRTIWEYLGYSTHYKCNDPAGYLLSSRGCPYRCIYCSTRVVHGRSFRPKSAERVFKEMKERYDKYGVRKFGFVDDNFTVSVKRVEKICDMICAAGWPEEGVIWSCYSRVNNLTRNLLVKMKAAGCVSLNFGIESGDEKVLEIIKKDIKLDEVRNALKVTKELGFFRGCNFMVGHWGDTRESVLRTLEFAIEIEPDYAAFWITTPYPGTELYELAKEKGRMFSDSYGGDLHDLRKTEFKPVYSPPDLEVDEMVELTIYVRNEYNRRMRAKRALQKLGKISPILAREGGILHRALNILAKTGVLNLIVKLTHFFPRKNRI